MSNVISNERFTVIKLFDWLMFNIYVPCSGTLNRHLIYSDIIHKIQSLFSVYPDCKYLIGGDFNVCLDSPSPDGDIVKNFLIHNNLFRCDVLFPVATKHTYT